ncbi:hypothetical protein EBU71_14245 [bacterium]|nr:hypothetical protein [Candidatus Elulimicrobium humile]
MSATIKTTSVGLIINDEYTLNDHLEMFSLLDSEPDFAPRLKYAITQKFEELCTDLISGFNEGTGYARPDLVMAYVHQMQLCTTVLQNLYPQYRRSVDEARNA